ncbi:MAG TPA: diiron oxygenase [Acidimicrobiales bacterium]|nr:diiron oxygenase [Acidimicrobiales bacterium]
MEQVTTTRRVEKLNQASQARVIDPDRELPGALGDGAVLAPDLLLPTAGLDGGVLDPERYATFSREALAAITRSGLMFEAVLMAGFGLEIAGTADVTDPRVTYLLHEVGEETRHSRLFVRLLDQLGPTAPNPLDNWLTSRVTRRVVDRIVHHPALLYTMVLAGEEIPDLLQKRAAEHPATDPFVRAVNRYHRQEEARHLSFARGRLAEVWATASPVDRALVRFAAPTFIREMYEAMIHPGVFGAVGLPAMRTWRAARSHPGRVQTRVDATRPVLDVLLDTGALRRGHVPRPWQRLCLVDAHGRPAAP